MTKQALLALALLSLVGCHSHKRHASIEFVITPDRAAQTVTVSCTSSSTNKCHFAFAGNASPEEATVAVGNTFIFRNVDPNALYCANSHNLPLDICTQTSIPQQRATITKRFSSDSRGD